MPTLTVRDFSCIDAATIDLARLTVIVGPQASGKSVLSKLIYFFQEVISAQVHSFDVETDFDAFKERVSADFMRWFPVSAWGTRKFHIEYRAGPISIIIDRKKSYKSPSQSFHILFSEFFRDTFERTADAYQKAREQMDDDRSARGYFLDLPWRLRGQTEARLSAAMGDDFISSQIFVPAGRAFFTSVGKAIAVFDKGGYLDPATMSFGRYWAAVRDREPFGANTHFPQTRAKLMVEIFGGEVKADRDQEYVLSSDGRKVPFSALSSGQQELLPLWTVLESYFYESDGAEKSSDMMFVEEPEAHLFPHAQSKIIEYMAAKLYTPRGNRRRMLITTHSPYVLAKINNLIKASVVGKRASKETIQLISRLIPRPAWLRVEDVQAYAIIGRRLECIRTDTGLIDGIYLDSVSEEIMEQFSSLLEIENAA